MDRKDLSIYPFISSISIIFFLEKLRIVPGGGKNKSYIASLGSDFRLRPRNKVPVNVVSAVFLKHPISDLRSKNDNKVKEHGGDKSYRL